MANSADPDQLASSELKWISTVCTGRIYPGSAGLGLKLHLQGIFNENGTHKILTKIILNPRRSQL